MPKVSVLIPLHNAAKSLEKALVSVLNQSFEDLEVICFDDGSTDGSSDILRRLAEADRRVTALGNPARHGVGWTRNACLEQARGDYLMFVDADDSLEPGAIERCVEAAQEHAADIISFRLNVHVGYEAEPSIRPRSLNARFCQGLWDRPLRSRDISERLFQLGVGLNNAINSQESYAESRIASIRSELVNRYPDYEPSEYEVIVQSISMSSQLLSPAAQTFANQYPVVHKTGYFGRAFAWVDIFKNGQISVVRDEGHVFRRSCDDNLRVNNYEYAIFDDLSEELDEKLICIYIKP
jgi:glycosyltransferase involved in cell wall biosynthesis